MFAKFPDRGHCSLVLGASLLAGCASQRSLTLTDVGRTLTVAVAPALNHSDSTDVDPLRVADLMISEMTRLPGVRVLPLNRVLAQLGSEHKRRVESGAHALSLMERLGADRVVVFAITEYDPYYPPVVGIAAQMYGYPEQLRNFFDPVAASRNSSASSQSSLDPRLPRAEVQRVFDGSDDRLAAEIRRFAEGRDADNPALGWRKFLASQEDFLRFCCHRIATELIRQEVTQVALQLDRQEEVEQR